MLRSIRDGDKLLVGMDGELDHFCAQSIRRELDSMLADPTIRQLILELAYVPRVQPFGVSRFSPAAGVDIQFPQDERRHSAGK